MTTRKVWSAEELERLSPNERHEIVRAGFGTDLSVVPDELLARVRRKIEARVEATEGSPTSER